MQSSLTADRGLWSRALWTVPVIIGGGLLSGWLSNSGTDNFWYAGLLKPAFQPPGWAFGVAWVTLYALMGVALAIILGEPPSKERRDALWLFGGQLALNYAWSPVFFGMRMMEVGLVIIVAMLLLALMTARWFRQLRPLAGWLMLPYLLWLCLAVALNYEIARLNPTADSAPLGILGA